MFKRTSTILAIASAIAILSLLGFAFDRFALAGCAEPYRKDKVITIGVQNLMAETVSSPASLQKGLSGRSCIADNRAMLFMFDKPGYYSFWMKDMRFPIDIVWLNEQKQIIYIEPNVQPNSYPNSFGPDQISSYVIEMHSAEAKKLGMKTGQTLLF